MPRPAVAASTAGWSKTSAYTCSTPGISYRGARDNPTTRHPAPVSASAMLYPAIPVTPTTNAVRSMVLDDDLTLDVPSTVALRFSRQAFAVAAQVSSRRGARTASHNKGTQSRGSRDRAQFVRHQATEQSG